MKTALFFNDNEMELLNIVLERTINEDEDFILGLHEGEEKECWVEELNDLRKIKVILNKKGVEERGIILQELQKIDDMIDGQIEEAIAKRHGVEI